ncbi:hypothetical protein DFH27DRAFT_609697 [Peziza echinospora]|nr:hypothetical protein DFH27DRAFT_609697 [Peziza echinospora]
MQDSLGNLNANLDDDEKVVIYVADFNKARRKTKWFISKGFKAVRDSHRLWEKSLRRLEQQLAAQSAKEGDGSKRSSASQQSRRPLATASPKSPVSARLHSTPTHLYKRHIYLRQGPFFLYANPSTSMDKKLTDGEKANMLIAENIAQLTNSLLDLCELEPVTDLGTNISLIKACQHRGEAYRLFGHIRKHGMKMGSFLEKMNLHLDNGEEVEGYAEKFNKSRLKAKNSIAKCVKAIRASQTQWEKGLQELRQRKADMEAAFEVRIVSRRHSI